MNFIINHSGFFLGISIMMLFALIGYYADKKDSSKNKNTDNSSKSTTLDELPGDGVSTNDIIVDSNQVDESLPRNGKFINFVNVDSDIASNANTSLDNVQNSVSNIDDSLNNVQSNMSDIDSFSDAVQNDVSNSVIGSDISNLEQNNVGVEQKNNVTSIDSGNNNESDQVTNVDQDNVGQNGSISFGVNDFEDINMSLEDLEKKNYNEIINNNALDDSENYYYSDLEEPTVDNDVMSNSLNLNNAVDNDIPNESFDSINSHESINDQIDNDVMSNSLNSVTNDTNDVSHEFDSEVQFEDSVEESNNVSDNTDSVPEIFTGENSGVMQDNSVNDDKLSTDGAVIDPLNSSSDDDIWKF